MEVCVFLVSLCASCVGGICGIGGGVVIKPVLDAFGIMSVSAISFLSGLTALAMSSITVFRQRKLQLVDQKTGGLLGIGAILGGIAGNELFHAIKTAAGDDAFVGAVQASALGIITLATLIYSAYLRKRIKSYTVTSPAACILIGCFIGVSSSFLGIGGGPINLAVLYFAFSMDTKTAASTSLYMIVFSQSANLLSYFVKGSFPAVPLHYLALMILAGFLGGMIGSNICKKISAETTDRLFSILLALIILICVYNTWRFSCSPAVF